MSEANQELQELLAGSNAIPEKLEFYDGKVVIYYNDALHAYYRMVDDVPILVAGVTTVLGVLDKPALPQWAANMTVEYLRQNVPYVKLNRAGIVNEYIDKPTLESLFNDARFRFRQIKKEAADIGTIAHDWLEAYTKQLINALDVIPLPPLPENEAARNCVQLALNWMEKHDFYPKNSERKIYSATYDYSGTYDFDAEITSCGDEKCCPFTGTLNVLGDYKTSKAIYDEYRYQTSAYVKAKLEEHPNDSIKGRVILRVGREAEEFEAKVLIGDDMLDTDFNVFLGALLVYNSTAQDKQDKKHAKELAKKVKIPKVKVKQKVEIPEAA